MIGKTISDNYKLIELLSEGGTSEVFLAEDNSTGKIVVIKLIKEHLLHGDEGDKFNIIERLKREAKISEQLDNEDIITAKKIDEYMGRYYIVLDYINGISLDTLMARETFGIGFILKLTMELCKILDYAHSKGVIHRDLKPPNIMITDEGKIKILDFGLALNLMDLKKVTYEGSILGTANYMPPEQAMDSTVDQRADLYSLGVILYEMLTGRKPFTGSGKITVIMQHLNDIPKLPTIYNPSIPPYIEQITMKLLEKKPEDRFSSAGELLEALQKDIKEEEIVENLSYKGVNFLNHRPTLIGRDEHFNQLYTEVDKLKDEERIKLILLTGKEGTGKTRLLDAIEIYTKIRNLLFIRSSCCEDKRYIPYYTLTQSLISLFEKEKSNLWNKILQNTYDNVKEKLDKIYTSLFPLLDRYIREGQEEIDTNINKTFLEFLIDVSTIKPLIIGIDNFHWTDISTFNLISDLAKNDKKGHILIICTIDEDKISDEDKIIPDFNQCKENLFTKSIKLGNLNPTQAGEMIKSILMIENIEDKILQKIYLASKGNPEFIKEAINLLIESKVLIWKDKNWTLDPARKKYTFPSSIRSLLDERINLLDTPIKELLKKTSILGENFSESCLNLHLEEEQGNDELNKEKHLFLLEQAIKNRFIIKRKIGEENIYNFKNQIIRDIFYNSMEKEEKQELHLTIAQKLELNYEEWEIPELIELGHHFSIGQDFSLSNFYLMQAGDKAKSMGLHDAAQVINSKVLAQSEDND